MPQVLLILHQDVHKQLTDLCTRYGMDPTLSCQSEYENLLRCLVTGLSQNVALLQPDGSYKSLSGNQQVHIHPSSVLFQKKADAVVFFELVCTTKRYLRKISRIHPAWLVEMLPKPDQDDDRMNSSHPEPHTTR